MSPLAVGSPEELATKDGKIALEPIGSRPQGSVRGGGGGVWVKAISVAELGRESLGHTRR